MASRGRMPLARPVEVVNAAMALSRFKVGKDNKSAYERQRGRKCRVDTVPFGEKVWFRQLTTQDGRKISLQSKWREGVWLGVASHAEAQQKNF